MAAKLRKGDNVVVIAGKDKGKKGEITRVMPKDNKALVGGVNVAIRHTKQSQASQGGRLAKAMPIELSNLALMDKNGKIFEKKKPDLQFDYRTTNITAKFILETKINMTAGDPEQITKTIKENWVYKKNNQPLNTINSGCIFKNPRGMSAGAMIDRAGLKSTKIGGAIVSEKHANFFIAQKGCTSKDILQLIDIVKEKVQKQFNVELELEIEIWK
jgi:UDP-N-acetylmuramate dehydrogenase